GTKGGAGFSTLNAGNKSGSFAGGTVASMSKVVSGNSATKTQEKNPQPDTSSGLMNGEIKPNKEEKIEP
ncbi:MAG: hypothetical protein JXQ76_06000, partial [Campylobacterales bacterium]|nr:hypothetical protein [Campylobacterales bacterium]